MRSIEALAYRIRDSWDVHERAMHIPGHLKRSFATFAGLYFVDSSAVDGNKDHR